MKTHELIQGSPQWHTYRTTHHNASDAPVMLGLSPYKTRSQLMHEVVVGIAPEVDDFTQSIFDAGYSFEALARPLAEEVTGQDLYPVVGSLDSYSASFDGLTMDNATCFEHKTMNKLLTQAFVQIDSTLPADERNGVRAGSMLPEMYRAQMEQQLMVAQATACLFMASEWTDGGELIEERHCWYSPDSTMRQRIIDGWAQFEID